MKNTLIVLCVIAFSSCFGSEIGMDQKKKCYRIWKVSSSVELLSAMQNSTGGDTIVCSPGDYVQLRASDISKTSKVVILAADRFNPPRFTDNPSLILTRLSNFSIEGLFFDGTGHVDSYGYPAGTAIKYGFLTDVTFRNCTLDFWHIGVSYISDPGVINTNILFEYNKFSRRGMDCFRIYRPHNGLTIRYNLFENDYIDVSRSKAADRHPDIVQFATGGKIVGSKNVVIEYNKCVLLDSYSHCFFLWNDRINRDGEKDDSIYHYSITVQGNDIIAPHVNAIAFGGCRGVNCNGNRIRISPPDTYDGDAGTPMINFYGGCEGTVTNNAMPAAVNAQVPGALIKIKQSGNIYPTVTRLPVGWKDIDNQVGPYAYKK
jgi:hypothetical protein